MADNVPVVQEVQLSNLKVSVVTAVGGIIILPVNVVKTLIQLGYEPFPCEIGKVYIFGGRSAYFLPNIFKYTYMLAKRDGFGVLWKGLDCYFLYSFTNEFVRREISGYLNNEYPTLGGSAHPNANDFTKLNDKEALAVAFRNLVRDMVSCNTAIIIARPFSVLFVRQVAQIIGQETKYTNVLSDIYTIGHEEGLKGFFSGLAVALVGTSVGVIVHHLCSFIIERSLLKLPRHEQDTEEENISKVKRTKYILENFVPIICNSWSYPYQLVSSIMAVSGSQLVCSLMPYTPPYNHFEDFFAYLKPNGSLTRGNKLFLRQQKGPIQITMDEKIYANNRYIS